MKLNGVRVEDTYAEAFDGLFCRLIVTAKDRTRLERAVGSATALPSTVFGESEGGVEQWLMASETPDGREGAIIQLWVNYSKSAIKVLEHELGKRIRQGVLVVPTTRVFNALDSDERIDTLEKIGHCGDGFEHFQSSFGREMINVPIMMGEFLIERWVGVSKGVMGGNIWIYCDSEETALKVGDLAVDAVSRVPYAIAPFEICSAGSKVETNYPDIGPTTNHLFCPALRGKIRGSKVPSDVKSIPEIVINGKSLENVKHAMLDVINTVKDENGVLFLSAGNFDGKLGKYKIFLKDLLK